MVFMSSFEITCPDSLFVEIGRSAVIGAFQFFVVETIRRADRGLVYRSTQLYVYFYVHGPGHGNGVVGSCAVRLAVKSCALSCRAPCHLTRCL